MLFLDRPAPAGLRRAAQETPTPASCFRELIIPAILQSYVTEWPGVMCIYGVTRVGSGTVGSSRVLPPLLATLQATKPLVVFLSGAGFVLYAINRRTRTAPLTGRVLLVLLAAGLVAAGDEVAEVAYLVIPKKEVFLSSGCCMALFDADGGASRFVPKALGVRQREVYRRTDCQSVPQSEPFG